MNKVPQIVFANAKGGVGKTTAAALAALGFAEANYRVGVRDTDVSQRSLSRLLEKPAFLAKPNIKPATPGTNDVDVIIVDSPPRLSERHFIAAVQDADLVCLVTMPSLLELEPTAETYRTFKRDLPATRVCILLNALEPGRRLTRELDARLETVGLGKAAVLKNTLDRREQYRHAPIEGWQVLDPEARNRVGLVVSELYLLATKTTK